MGTEPYDGTAPATRGEGLGVLVYVSAASRELTGEELRGLLEAARAKNAAAGITGMLLYHRGGFMQALEGPASAIDALFVRIMGDPRHKNIIVVTRKPRAQRTFDQWSMGFVDLSNAQVPDGYSPLLHDPAVREAYAASPDRVLQFLAHYARAEAMA